MERKEISEKLFEQVKMVEPYPKGVAKIEKQCEFTAFFPGGKGVWDEGDTEIFLSIMVLGHDFSTEKKFNEMLEGKANDLNSPTWRNMIKLFGEAGIFLEDCFFTNIFMGLRKTESMVGPFPGFRDKNFVARNTKFLEYQIELLKPSCIITLGRYAGELLSGLTDDLYLWRDWKVLKHQI